MEFIKTDDDSMTLRHPLLEEQYHSIKGALTESMHIFIKLGLQHSTKKDLRILEMGFGTGLNALLTQQEAEGVLTAASYPREIEYTTLELYPLSEKDALALNYQPSDILQTLHQSQWGIKQRISKHFVFLKEQQNICDAILPLNYFDVVYYDAFSPETQPELWTQTVFKKLYDSMRIGGVLTTYCSKGVVRRGLQAVGFKVERLPGPPKGKREVLRAIKIEKKCI